MAELMPITRLEQLIVDAKEGTTPTQNAITRVEMFLARIAGANVVTPSPITRIETFLASIAGDTVTLPKPLTRVETFLAAIAGEDVETPTPITRVEIFLAEWAEGGGGSVVKTITGEAPITFDALAATLVSLTQDGKTVQDGTPTPDNPVDIVCNNGTLKMVDDEYNCLTLCSGSLNADPNNNVADIVRKHCDRIAFAHIRNVKHFENGDFSEASHRDCDGDTGILEILKAYHDCGFEGYIRPDHGRHLWNEGPGNVRPGYGLYDRALGIMYMLGVWDSLEKFDKVK